MKRFMMLFVLAGWLVGLSGCALRAVVWITQSDLEQGANVVQQVGYIRNPYSYPVDVAIRNGRFYLDADQNKCFESWRALIYEQVTTVMDSTIDRKLKPVIPFRLKPGEKKILYGYPTIPTTHMVADYYHTDPESGELRHDQWRFGIDDEKGSANGLDFSVIVGVNSP